MREHVSKSLVELIRADFSATFGTRVFASNRERLYPDDNGDFVTIDKLTAPFAILGDGGSVVEQASIGFGSGSAKVSHTFIFTLEIFALPEPINTDATTTDTDQIDNLADEMAIGLIAQDSGITIKEYNSDPAASIGTAVINQVTVSGVEGISAVEDSAVLLYRKELRFEVVITRTAGATYITT